MTLIQTLTTGSIHDSNVFEQLLTGHEEAVYADSSYKSQKHEQLLEDNASQARYVVGQTFGLIKKYYGLSQARYMSIERNQARLTIICIAHNLKGAVNI